MVKSRKSIELITIYPKKSISQIFGVLMKSKTLKLSIKSLVAQANL